MSKKWLSKELHSLVNEKHRNFSEGKKYFNQQLLDSYKVLRKNENRILSNAFDDYTKQFFENLQIQKIKGNLSKAK